MKKLVLMLALNILALTLNQYSHGASVCVTIPNAQASRVTDDLCAFWGYQETVVDTTQTPAVQIPNPETKAQFVQRMWAQHLKDIIISQETSSASRSAISSTTADINTNIPIQ